MARGLGSVCKLCRRENVKLMLKGYRCMTDKCAFERKPYPPGQHGQGKSKFSEYGTQLREKQKIKRIYGVLDAQFSRFFDQAERAKGVTGANLLQLMERRLDNTVYKTGFASSINEARQLIRHKHFYVNNNRVTIPSYIVKQGDKISLKEKSRKITRILSAMEAAKSREVPKWLMPDWQNFQATVKDMPMREDVTMPIEEQLVVELYSR